MSLEPPTNDADPVDVDGAVVAPSITTGAVRARTGSQFTLTCRSSGVPRPSITWLHNGAVILDDDDQYFIFESVSSDGTVSSTLTVRNAQQSDAGDFSCVGSSAGSSGAIGTSMDVAG